MQTTCNPEAIQYYYNMRSVYFVSHYPYAFLDGKKYPLEETPLAAGSDILVAAADLEKIFGPSMRFEAGYGSSTFFMDDLCVKVFEGSREIQRNGEWMVLAEAVQNDHGVWYVPAGELMQKGFGKTFLSSKNPVTPVDPMNWPVNNTVIEVTNEKKISFQNQSVRNIHIQMRGKSYGELRECYWMEEIRKVVPYNLYIPSTYSPENPSKLLVALHGGRVSEDFIFEKTQNRIQYFCEKYGYILLCPNAAIMDSTYGCLIPNYQFLENGMREGHNPENPMGYSAEVIRLMKAGEQDVLNTIELVKSKYVIDESRIFMLGNSMGGIGTFHFAATYPNLLRAIAPCGGCPHMEYFKPGRLGKIPIHFVYGSEDDWGADYLDDACGKMLTCGCNLETEIIGGGRHGDAWVTGLEGIFTFFEKFSK